MYITNNTEGKKSAYLGVLDEIWGEQLSKAWKKEKLPGTQALKAVWDG